jgi:putative N-acetylmannosamine-6-phosphate epimerase
MTTELRRGLVVSCQAEGDSPFNAPRFIAAFARAAEIGGAVGVRVCGLENIRAAREAVALPIIGLTKGLYEDGSVLITPDLDQVDAILGAGADYVAMDATTRPRPGGVTGTELVREACVRLSAPAVADVSTHEEGILAARAGATFVATTLAGYTPATADRQATGPDLDLVSSLARALPDVVIAEGRIWTPDEARAALALGAHAVVVGTAITRPVDIVRRWVDVLDGVINRTVE